MFVELILFASHFNKIKKKQQKKIIKQTNKNQAKKLNIIRLGEIEYMLNACI